MGIDFSWILNVFSYLGDFFGRLAVLASSPTNQVLQFFRGFSYSEGLDPVLQYVNVFTGEVKDWTLIGFHQIWDMAISGQLNTVQIIAFVPAYFVATVMFEALMRPFFYITSGVFNALGYGSAPFVISCLFVFLEFVLVILILTWVIRLLVSVVKN